MPKMDERSLQYLAAMQVPVWVLRNSADGAGEVETAGDVGHASTGPLTLYLGPGSGGLLLVCEEASMSASALAADLARALPEPPVWAWPDAQAPHNPLEGIVRERLLTGIAVLGSGLATRCFPGCVPTTLGSARVVELPSIAELLADPQARRRCWQALLAAGLTARH
jgi:hypothetical protein